MHPMFSPDLPSIATLRFTIVVSYRVRSSEENGMRYLQDFDSITFYSFCDRYRTRIDGETLSFGIFLCSVKCTRLNADANLIGYQRENGTHFLLQITSSKVDSMSEWKINILLYLPTTKNYLRVQWRDLESTK